MAIKRLLLLLYVLLYASYLISSNNTAPLPEFIVLITSYKNEKWAYDNLKSVCHQNSTKPYHVICINDCSPDKTGEVMDAYVQEHNLQDKVTVIHNKERVGAGANIYNAVHSIPDHKIVVCVDGDDTLAHNNVLLRLEAEYKDPDVWVTYGSFTPVLDYLKKGLPERIIRMRKIRKYQFVTQQLKTFRAALFKKVKKEDQLWNGKFFPVAHDVAWMIPMLEMASPVKKSGKIRIRFIRDIIYNYRMDNPINDFRVNGNLQRTLDKYVRTLRPYKPLIHL